jgi:3-deoxy-manno-octulosonate cytidylyltransferase (CMP-KDO synthetase)
MKITAIIPARYGSTRFPGKALADILGRPMIQHVYERTRQATLVSQTIIATDDQRIADAVISFGGDVIMTSPKHETGTDRLAEVAGKLDCDLVVNVQGDEPLIEPAMIDQAIRPFLTDNSLKMGTLKSRIRQQDDLLSPNLVKVVTDGDDNALYFSRSPIPFYRDSWQTLQSPDFKPEQQPCFKHVGLYVYRRDFLLEYAGWPQTFLEVAEKLEQLRALENGVKIKVVETEFESVGVDTPQDLAKVIKLINQGAL